MESTLKFDPEDYTAETLQLIMAKAEEEQCTPSEAAVKLLNEVAARSMKKVA